MFICTQCELSLAAGCGTDIPDGISALRQLTSLEYWIQATCPPPQMSCLRALKSLAVDWDDSIGGVDDTWIEGIACSPSLKQLRYTQCGRLPSEFHALQLTSLNLGSSHAVLFDAVMVEKGRASASANYHSAEGHKVCRSANSRAGPERGFTEGAQHRHCVGAWQAAGGEAASGMGGPGHVCRGT